MKTCPTCQPIRCCDGQLLEYNITGGTVYFNEQTSIEFTCPPGFSCIPGVYTVPAGRIRMVVGSNPTTLRLTCCQSELVRQVPAGATQAEINAIVQSMVNTCAVQQANCDAQQFVQGSFRSAQVSYNPCSSSGRLMGWTSPSRPPLPSAMTWNQGVLYLAAGVFSSTIGPATATANAQEFLNAYAIGLIAGPLWDCGYWNTEQTVICEDESEVVVPAFSFFSADSQAAADVLAVAFGESECPSEGGCFDWAALTWTPTVVDTDGTTGDGTASGSGLGDQDGFTASIACFAEAGTASIQTTTTASGEWTGDECQACLIFKVDRKTSNPSIGLIGGVDVLVDSIQVYAFSAFFAPSALLIADSSVGDVGFSQTILIPITIPAGSGVPVSVTTRLAAFINGNFTPRSVDCESTGRFVTKKWTTSTDDFVMPSIGGTVTIKGANLSWLGLGQQFSLNAGFISYIAVFQVVSIVSPTEVTAEYVSFAGADQAGNNVAAGAWIFEALTSDL